jgi:hypothetical protein
VTALTAADVAHRDASQSGDGDDRARIAMLACKHDKPTRDLDPRNVQPVLQPAVVALEAMDNDAAAIDRVVDALGADESKISGETRLRLAPFAIGDAVTKDNVLEALATFAPRNAPVAAFDVDAIRSPWLLLETQPTQQLVFPRPDIAGKTAAALMEVLESVPEERTECNGDECPTPAALEMPRAVMREAVRALWLDVATYHARSGQKDKALAAVAKATKLTPARRRHQSAPIHLAVGDAAGAVQLLADDVKDIRRFKPPVRTRILLNHALALAHENDFENAYASAERAYAAAAEARHSIDSIADTSFGNLILEHDRHSAAWLWAALAIKTGRGTNVHKVLADGAAADLQELVAWLEMAITDEEQRRPKRWSLTLRKSPAAVLPAVMYAVSRAVPEEVDVDVWLDRIFDREHLREPVRGMLARAEAARWRGDEGSERMWLERAARMRGLYDDYASTVLAHIAELR